MVADAPHLDGQYAAFGKITDNAQAAAPARGRSGSDGCLN